jgi:hypothetical protein
VVGKGDGKTNGDSTASRTLRAGFVHLQQPNDFRVAGGASNVACRFPRHILKVRIGCCLQQHLHQGKIPILGRHHQRCVAIEIASVTEVGGKLHSELSAKTKDTGTYESMM